MTSKAVKGVQYLVRINKAPDSDCGVSAPIFQAVWRRPNVSIVAVIMDMFSERVHALDTSRLFVVSDWLGRLLKNNKRWKYGVPPAGTAITSRFIPA
jgi:hypothetical protein